MRKSFVAAYLLSLIAGLAPAVAPQAAAASVATPDVQAMDMVGAKASLPAMKSAEGGIELSASPDEVTVFTIYSITGQLVKNVRVDAGAHTTVSLQGGCFVVRCEAWAKKIVVR